MRNNYGNAISIGVLCGLLTSIFIALAAEQWFLNKKTDEIFLLDKHKDVYVCCRDKDTGRTTLHQVDVNHISEDCTKANVTYNGMTFKCNQPMENKEFVIRSEKPEMEEYDNICPECCG